MCKLEINAGGTPGMSRVTLPCSCAGTCKIATVVAFDGDPQDGVFVEFYTVAGPFSRFALAERMRKAWRLMRGHQVTEQGIVIQDIESIRALRDFADRVIADVVAEGAGDE